MTAPKNADFDVILQKEPPESVGDRIAQHILSKGFCVLWPGFTEALLETAREDATELDFYHVNSLIAAGLLGPEGSSQIADLESKLDDEARSEGEALKALDASMTKIGYTIAPYASSIHPDMDFRSNAVLHQAGDADDMPTPLSERDFTKWQLQFIRHVLMVVVFLGPKSGHLELQPFVTEDAEPQSVRTVPGMMVLLRADMLTHSFSAQGDSLALSSFWMTGPLKAQLPEDGPRLSPAARQLEDWSLQRIKELKADQALGSNTWDPEIPRGWRKAMNHAYYKGQMTGVAGMAVHFPATYDPVQWVMASSGGVDYVTEVPLTRWRHEDLFDPAADSWKQHKTCCKHGAFAEGLELFDNKFFSLSPAESKGLDPQSRVLLETGYSSLAAGGVSKKACMNANGGVYVGMSSDEWAYNNGVACAIVAGAQCMNSGRISFCLGMKGPALTINCEAASGLVVAHLASDSVQKKASAVGCDFAMCAGVNIMLQPVWWHWYSRAGLLSRVGRCMSFDAGADGYARGDGCGAITVKSMTQLVEGTLSSNNQDFNGAISGGAYNQNGTAASQTAPYGPAQQELVNDVIRNASIWPQDVDYVETHGQGSYVSDAFEANSLWRAHRSEADTEPLVLCSVKSCNGNQVDAAGSAGLIKVVSSIRLASMTPNLHLTQCNPYMDPFEQPLAIPTECLSFPYTSSFGGVMAYGYGGTNAYMLAWSTVDSETVRPPPPEFQRELVYWPAGGGELEADRLPTKPHAYSIAGTWSGWRPQPMAPQGGGVYTSTVRLGENRWESFQIWLDGDPSRALHPGDVGMPQCSPVYGPGHSDIVRSALAPSWTIDGRMPDSQTPPLALVDLAGQAIEDRIVSQAEPTKQPSAGLPGDSYRVSLHISGKWRMVDWEKLQGADVAVSSSAGPVGSTGTYFVTGSWNDWTLDEMSKDPSTPGLFTLDVVLSNFGPWPFQIVRDEDWGQVLYPAENTDSGTPALGPDAFGEGLTWTIRGRAGSAVRIEFQRMFEGGEDIRTVSWQQRS